MAIHTSGPSGVTTVDDVYQHYTEASAVFYIDGHDIPITEIQPCQDGSSGYELIDANGQTIFVDTDELMWLTNPERGDDYQ